MRPLRSLYAARKLALYRDRDSDSVKKKGGALALSVGVGSCERTLSSKAGVMRRATECAQIERSIDQQDQMQDDHLSMLSLYFIFLLLLYDN